MPHAKKLDQPFVDLSEKIKNTPLFSGISEDVIAEFAKEAHLRSEPKGKILFLHGDDAEWFYLIVHGWVKLFRETIEGTEAVIDVLTSGHMFGDGTVFEDGKYGYGAEAVEPTQFIMLPTSMLKRSIETNNHMALNMLSSMSQHRRQQNREIEHLNVQNAPQRIGCFLLRLCPTSPSPSTTLNLPYDKTLIASRLGMKAETFSRALAKLKSETGIQIHGPTVTIQDIQRLVSYTCNHCSDSFPCEDIKG